jgi:hypothetical protein
VAHAIAACPLCRNYFQSETSAANNAFVTEFKNTYGQASVIGARPYHVVRNLLRPSGSPVARVCGPHR